MSAPYDDDGYDFDASDNERLLADNEALRRQLAEARGEQKIQAADFEERLLASIKDAPNPEALREVLAKAGRLAGEQ